MMQKTVDEQALVNRRQAKQLDTLSERLLPAHAVPAFANGGDGRSTRTAAPGGRGPRPARLAQAGPRSQDSQPAARLAPGVSSISDQIQVSGPRGSDFGVNPAFLKSESLL